MKKIILLILSIFLITGCSPFENNSLKNADIYTTTYPVNYLIDYLYGDNSNIYSIYPSDVNFKEYELSEKKINEFAKSSLFVFNSQDIDRNYAVSMLNENKNLLLIDTTLGMNYTHSIEELWLNPYNYLMMAKNTKTSLNEYIADPYINKQINEKYEQLQYELSKLDALYKETLKDAKYTTIVTDNDLFKFLEKYNIEVISLEEDIKTIKVKETDNLSDISKEYNVSISDILTYNNKLDENIYIGETIKIPIKTIETSNVNKVKKLISEEKISYIFSNQNTSNNIVNDLIKEYDLELLPINTMYSINGDISNNNQNYLTIMNDNLELLKKELYK